MSRGLSKVSWSAVFFCLAALAAMHQDRLLESILPTTLGPPWSVIIRTAVLITTWCTGGMLLNRLLGVFFWGGFALRFFPGGVPKLLIDVVSGIIYLLVFLAVVVFVFGYPLTGIWATSGVVGLVLGLALRNVILDVFIGLAVNFDRPYKIGDWVMVHGRRPFPEENVIGCILEINWRTTRLRTTDNNLVMVPNSVMGQKIITNFMVPGERSRFRLPFTLDFSVPPERALRVLEAAVRSAQGVLEEPKAPRVRINTVNEMGVEYEIRYWILPEKTSPSKARHRINQAVLEHLAQAGLTLAYPKHDIYHEKMPTRHLDTASVDDRIELLDKVPLFSALQSEELRELAQRVDQRTYLSGESIIRRGDQGDSMFVLLEGLLAVQISVAEDDGKSREEEVTRIAPGQFFGEMSLLTGERRSATVLALTDTVVYEVRRDDLDHLLRKRPALAEAMSRALAVHQLRDAQIRSDLSRQAREDQIRSTADRIINRMKVLFGAWSQGNG